MARPITISDDEILEHARQVFLSSGVRATTAEVAKQAGVSEALIFKRFGTKESLFRNAMQAAFNPDDIEWLKSLPGRVGKGDIRQHLCEIGVAAIEFNRKLMPLVAMSWSSRDEPHAGKEPFAARRMFEAYFEAERAAGRIRKCDTEILAKVFMGSCWHFVSWELMLGANDPRPLGAEAFVRGLVDQLWFGIAP